MKSCIAPLIFLCAFCLVAPGISYGQAGSSPAPAVGGEAPGKGAWMDFLRNLTKELGINEARAGQVLKIEQQRLNQVKENTKALFDRVKSVLTAEQQAILEKNRAEREGSWIASHEGGATGAGHKDTFRDLNLQKDQKIKIMGIIKEEMGRIKAEREALEGEISKLLTPEQFKKFQDRRKELIGGRLKQAEDKKQ